MRLGMAPMHPGKLVERLTRLMTITAKRAGSEADVRSQLAVYAEELAAYPADVATAALNHAWHWWPTWAELRERCERAVSRRRSILRIIEGWEPWSDEDERRHLQAAFDNAHFDIGRYRRSDPDLSSAAAEARGAFEAMLAEMG